jgi:hypothetical protein
VDPHRPHVAKHAGLLSAPGEGNSLAFPYMAVRPGGDGIVSFIIAGNGSRGYYPSPGFAVLSRGHMSQRTVVQEGLGPLDTSNGYFFATGLTPGVGLLGQYSAADLDAQTRAFWVAAEYVAQTCNSTVFENESHAAGHAHLWQTGPPTSPRSPCAEPECPAPSGKLCWVPPGEG